MLSRNKVLWTAVDSIKQKCGQSPHRYIIYQRLGMYDSARERNGLLLCHPCRKSVSTWSPLASVFNTKATKKVNFSLIKEETGLFALPQLQDSSGFHLLREKAIIEADKLVQEACSNNRNRKMVDIFDDLSDCLCRVADLAEFMRVAHPENKFCQAAEDASTTISGLVDELNTNRNLYDVLKQVVENGDVLPTDEVDQHVAKLFLFDFEQSGIHLGEDKRQQVVKLNEFIQHTGMYFVHGTTEPRSISKTKLPEGLRQVFSIDGDNVLVNSLHADISNPLAREAAYKIYYSPNEHQEMRLQQLLTSRLQLTQLCGFTSYSERALQGSLAGSSSMLTSFLNLLNDQLQPHVHREFHEMLKVKQKEFPGATELQPWDIPYLSRQITQSRYNLSDGELIPYFSVGSCMDGLNLLTNSLFDISLKHETAEKGELWSPEVHKLAVVDNKEGLLGYIYCDFFERRGKPPQDSHYTIYGGRELSDGSYQLPVVVLVLNFSQPSWNAPSLLTPSMVDNLFHEFGHGLHSMLARTRHQHVTGTRCSTDFAEVPSNLMEYFASDERVVSQFARHYKTGEPLPEHLLHKYCSSKREFAAADFQLQVFYSALDQRYHSSQPFTTSTSDVIKEVQQQFYPLPHVPNTAWQLRFGHLVTYGGKYYSYLVSRAVAAWIWQQGFIDDPFNKSWADRYRQELLRHGGSKPSRQLVENFFNTEVTPAALVKSIINEIDQQKLT